MKQITWQGETHSMVEWAEILGMKFGTFQARYQKAGGDMNIVTDRPVKPGQKSYFYKGKWYSARGIARLNGTISETGVIHRRERGWPVERIVETKVGRKKPREVKPDTIRYTKPQEQKRYTVPCRTCKYHDKTGTFTTCGYILVEKHRRPCPPPLKDRPCTARVEGKSVRQAMVLDEWSRWTPQSETGYNTWN